MGCGYWGGYWDGYWGGGVVDTDLALVGADWVLVVGVSVVHMPPANAYMATVVWPDRCGGCNCVGR